MATATADKKGIKRICPSCSTRYYDFNKRPILCPTCKAEFTADLKVKVRRRSAANDEDGQVSEDTAAEQGVLADEEEDVLEAEEGVVSLEDAEEDADIEEDEEAMELDEDDSVLDEEEDFDDEDLDDEEDFDEDEDDEEDAEDDTPKKAKKKR